MKEKKVKATFFVTMLFFMLIFSFFTLSKKHSSAAINATSWQEEIMRIDHQINDINSMKKEYEERSVSHANQQNQLCHGSGDTINAKRHLKLAKENTKIAQQLSKDIAELQHKKNKILKEHEYE
jgi:hypothetical protein